MKWRFGFVAGLAMFVPSGALAQEPQAAGQGMPHEMPMAMPMPMAANPLGIGPSREGSGTSWLPDDSTVPGEMWQRGAWMLMLHENVFVQYIRTGSDRGSDQFGSINWFMGMAQRPVAGGTLTLRSMISLEPLTVGRCGYPALLQSGEFCHGRALHDRQHPHDLFMELAADYRHAINEALAVEVYGGASGEPALGPTAYPHRLSAMPNPIAPASHHWLDSSHVAFGVVTGGLYGRTWKTEASIFNGREPDDARYNFDFAALDSYSGRVWWLPDDHWSIQASAGHLREAELGAAGDRQDVDRITASATYHRLLAKRVWATTIAWGRNHEGGHGAPTDEAPATSALMIETAADLTRRDTLFARGETIDKTAAELVLPLVEANRAFTIGKVQAGYTRWFAQAGRTTFGAGASVGLSLMPEALRPFYGTGTAGEFSVFLDVRPR